MKIFLALLIACVLCGCPEEKTTYRAEFCKDVGRGYQSCTTKDFETNEEALDAMDRWRGVD